MYEWELHGLLRDHPELIEPGLRFEGQEVAMGGGLRCDLLFRDKSNTRVYVEVKWVAGRRAVIQVEQYEVLQPKLDQGSRFILAAITARPGIRQLIDRRGFSLVLLDKSRIAEIMPEWSDSLKSLKSGHSKSSGPESSSKIPASLKDARSRFLQLLAAELLPELPNTRFEKSPEGRLRVVLPWSERDGFQFDFSGEVVDGVRLAFIVDLDQAKSQRRITFQDHLFYAFGEVEDSLRCPVVDKISNMNLISQGLERWAKVSAHRRMGVYIFRRFPTLDWDDTQKAVQVISPAVLQFIEGMDSLLQKHRPPAV